MFTVLANGAILPRTAESPEKVEQSGNKVKPGVSAPEPPKTDASEPNQPSGVVKPGTNEHGSSVDETQPSNPHGGDAHQKPEESTKPKPNGNEGHQPSGGVDSPPVSNDTPGQSGHDNAANPEHKPENGGVHESGDTDTSPGSPGDPGHQEHQGSSNEGGNTNDGTAGNSGNEGAGSGQTGGTGGDSKPTETPSAGDGHVSGGDGSQNSGTGGDNQQTGPSGPSGPGTDQNPGNDQQTGNGTGGQDSSGQGSGDHQNGGKATEATEASVDSTVQTDEVPQSTSGSSSVAVQLAVLTFGVFSLL